MQKRKNKDKSSLILSEKEMNQLQQDYIEEVENNLEYSLSVDPENKYNMCEGQKKFIEYYIQFKNVETAAELTGIDMDMAKQYFVSWNTQQEIRRINRALYHRQFNSKLLSLDEIGGYLTSLLTDENVPIGDQLKSRDKLAVAKMIIDLIELKKESFENPNVIMNKNLDIQIKNLSINTIQSLLNQNEKDKIELKNKLYENEDLSIEEKNYLETLPTETLLQLIEDSNKNE